MTEEERNMVKEDVNGAIMGYLDYILIRIKRNEDYEPHPILKALAIATNLAKKNGNYAGVSGNGDAKKGIEPTESYAVVIEKKVDGFIIKDIIDLITGHKLSIYDALLIIELSLKLEKIDGELVSEAQIKKILNEVFEGIKIEVISPTNYISARDYFKQVMEDGKIKLFDDEEIKTGLRAITNNTKWEDYNPGVRALIAGVWGTKKKSHCISIDSIEMPKKKVVQMFKSLFTGKIKKAILKKIEQDNKGT